MVYFYRRDADDHNFQRLIRMLDADLYRRYGEQMQFLACTTALQTLLERLSR